MGGRGEVERTGGEVGRGRGRRAEDGEVGKLGDGVGKSRRAGDRV